MNYTNGNYAAFSKARIPAGIENKKAYIIGGGLAGLSAAVFLIRDGRMPGKNITILEELNIPGGGCDGIKDQRLGYVIRGGREMESHFECLWDMYRSIPSLKQEGLSVLDEFYYLNMDDPSSSPVRVTEKCGQDAHTFQKYTLSDKALLEISALVLTPEEKLGGKTIEDVFSEDFFRSNFWMFWCTMFAFEKWHSAIEMRRYLTRYLHLTRSLSDLSALKFTTYNQYESLILPLMRYLEEHGVVFRYDAMVSNVVFQTVGEKKVASEIVLEKGGTIAVSGDDYVIVTLGCNTENSTLGDQNHAPGEPAGIGASWTLWENIAAQDPSFGNPKVFYGDVAKSNWESATVTCLDDEIPAYIRKLTGRDPYCGKIVTGGPITARDSSWLMSWTVSRQPHFAVQKEGELVAWVYGLFSDVPGDYVKKPMKECTGEEICQEWLYHIGVPVEKIPALAAKHSVTIPCMMPYVTSYFMARKVEDRPAVVPACSKNFAFVGEFVETPRDTVFTTEYAVRTGMEAVYTLLNLDRGVPEVFASCYDVRCLLDATSALMDGRKITDMKLGFAEKLVLDKVSKMVQGTLVEEMLKQYNLI